MKANTVKKDEGAGSFFPDMPFVSLILPFNPKMTSKSAISESMRRAVQKITNDLNGRYNGVVAELVLQKLQSALSTLNYATHKSSIAIFLSPVFEKILYLDMPVDEKVTVDSDFMIRDIVLTKSKPKQVLLIAPTGSDTRIYLADDNKMTLIISNNIGEMETCDHIRSIDNTLDILLRSYHLPVFVAADEDTCLQFKKHTRHSGEVLEYIVSPSVHSDTQDLQELLRPFIKDMETIQAKEISHFLARAGNDNHLTTGLDNINKTASCYQGSLLLIEKGYTYAQGVTTSTRPSAYQPARFSYIKDSVDDVIEKALLNGGDVAFVESGVLPGNEHIALIQHLH